MAQGTTAGNKLLTKRDQLFLQAGADLGVVLAETVPSSRREEFKSDWSRVSTNTRDAGYGRGGGALQRDAFCTRGHGGKVPLSNRNLRWHPLVAAYRIPQGFEPMTVRVSGKNLVFVDRAGQDWPVEHVHKLTKPHCVEYESWQAIAELVKDWSHSDWTQNSVVIPASEYCSAEDALETFAILGVTAASVCGASGKDAYVRASGFLREFGTDNSLPVPSLRFPDETRVIDLVVCPLCRENVVGPPGRVELARREPTWSAPWLSRKRGEGEGSSIQLTHVRPLIEREVRHTAEFTRYGHRWCNVAMADNDLDDVVAFFHRVTKRWGLEGRTPREGPPPSEYHVKIS